MSGRPAESASPGSAQSSFRGKKDAKSKQSGKPLQTCNQHSLTIYLILIFYSTSAEAMDFRNWCESECVRLIGTKGKLLLLKLSVCGCRVC